MFPMESSQQGSYKSSHLDTEHPGLRSVSAPWALCGALGITGCSWHQGMLGTGDTLDPLGMQDAQDTVGSPAAATHAP